MISVLIVQKLKKIEVNCEVEQSSPQIYVNHQIISFSEQIKQKQFNSSTNLVLINISFEQITAKKKENSQQHILTLFLVLIVPNQEHWRLNHFTTSDKCL